MFNDESSVPVQEVENSRGMSSEEMGVVGRVWQEAISVDNEIPLNDEGHIDVEGILKDAREFFYTDQDYEEHLTNLPESSPSLRVSPKQNEENMNDLVIININKFLAKGSPENTDTTDHLNLMNHLVRRNRIKAEVAESKGADQSVVNEYNRKKDGLSELSREMIRGLAALSEDEIDAYYGSE